MMRTLLLATAMLITVHAARADEDAYVQIQRGRALTVAGDCVACHSPAGRPAFSGGRAIETPFGKINSANLTPDVETGIGSWTADDFSRAMHEGLRPDGAHLYPAFPYTYYTRVTRADTDAIFAFFRTLPAVSNRVDRDTLPFPFDIRTSMIAWNAMFFTSGTITADPARSEAFNRGAYLVEGLGHCGACHTPMNGLGASRDSAYLQGNLLQGWVAPNITADARMGIGGWTEAAIVEYLRTGRNDVAAASGPMAEVVMNSTALMADADLHAIALYLKERGGAGTSATPIPANDPTMQVGQNIYADTCSACHTSTGAGIDRLFPRLAGAPNVQQTDATTLIRVVLTGTRAASTAGAPTAPAMPSLGWRLDDDQVAAVVTYIRNAWGNAAPPVTVSEVARLREKVAAR